MSTNVTVKASRFFPFFFLFFALAVIGSSCEKDYPVLLNYDDDAPTETADSTATDGENITEDLIVN